MSIEEKLRKADAWKEQRKMKEKIKKMQYEMFVQKQERIEFKNSVIISTLIILTFYAITLRIMSIF